MYRETEILHGGFAVDERTGATAPPVYQCSSFAYKTAGGLEDVFAGRKAGYVYSRIGNPTLDAFERRMASLEGGSGAVSCASGLAAIAATVMTLAGSGDELISSNAIFGGTRALFSKTLVRSGIRTRYVDANDIDAIRHAVNEKTKLIFVETIGNPKLNVADIASVSKVAAEAGVALVVDNTVTTPFLCRPRELGADIVVHSTSKYINGHGTAIGGAIVDGGKFDWDNDRYPHLRELQKRLGGFAFLAGLRSGVHRDFGLCLAPMNAMLMSIGIESLAVRMERHCSNAARLAERLAKDLRIEAVGYPGLPDHPNRELAKDQFGDRYGALVNFRLGSKRRCFAFADSLERILNLANLGDAKTLLVHPASTICRDASPEERIAMGASEDMLRLSVGIEHFEDIWMDIDRALDKVK